LASIASLALTIAVFHGVRRLKQFYLVTARLPQLLLRLRGHAANISNALNDIEAFRDRAVEEIIATEVTLGSLRAKLSGQPRHAVGGALAAFRKLNRRAFSAMELRDCYLHLLRVTEEIKNLQADRKWEP
jgi:hypothetical protein